MKKLLFAMAAVALVPMPAAAAEILNVQFNTPTGAVSNGLYAGQVRIRTSGTGIIWPGRISDTFYYLDSPNEVNNAYEMTFDTVPIPGLASSRRISNFIVGARPLYNPSHTYDFVINTGVTTPTKLYFGMWDGQFSDNSGSIQLQISGGVPEPAAWSMMLAGFGLVGSAMRRRQKVAVTFA